MATKQDIKHRNRLMQLNKTELVRILIDNMKLLKKANARVLTLSHNLENIERHSENVFDLVKRLTEANAVIGDLIGIHGGIMEENRLMRIVDYTSKANPKYEGRFVYNLNEMKNKVNSIAREWMRTNAPLLNKFGISVL